MSASPTSPAGFTIWHESLSSAREDRAGDLSEAGVVVVTDRPMAPGTAVFVELPAAAGGNRAGINASVHETLKGGMRLRFGELDDFARAEIQRLVADAPRLDLPGVDDYMAHEPVTGMATTTGAVAAALEEPADSGAGAFGIDQPHSGPDLQSSLPPAPPPMRAVLETELTGDLAPLPPLDRGPAAFDQPETEASGSPAPSVVTPAPAAPSPSDALSDELMDASDVAEPLDAAGTPFDASTPVPGSPSSMVPVGDSPAPPTTSATLDLMDMLDVGSPGTELEFAL